MILGRDYEQAEIEKFPSLVRTGEGRLLILIGEPGMGKTTLLSWTARPEQRTQDYVEAVNAASS